jgi:hypothetical protein
MGTFFSGSVDPFWPHVLLLTTAIVASFAVAIGIVLESPHWSIANALVVGGVAIEAVCTLFLFGFDEGVSNAQQSKIVALEQRLAARTLSDEQLSDVSGQLRSFAPQTFQIIPYWKNPESLSIADRIASALIKAGWQIDNPKVFTTLVGVLTGVIISADKDAPANIREARDKLVAALNDNGVQAYPDNDLSENPPSNKIYMQVGIKP